MVDWKKILGPSAREHGPVVKAALREIRGHRSEDDSATIARLTSENEALRTEATRLRGELARVEAELTAVAGAIGGVEFMDPPDGGDVSLAEQVRRMRAILSEREKSRKRVEELEAEMAAWKRRDNLSLHVGEMTAQEFRTVVAVLTYFQGRVRALLRKEGTDA